MPGQSAALGLAGARQVERLEFGFEQAQQGMELLRLTAVGRRREQDQVLIGPVCEIAKQVVTLLLRLGGAGGGAYMCAPRRR